MSAECSKCHRDIEYPEGTWPVGECTYCKIKDENEKLREIVAAVKLAHEQYHEVFKKLAEE